MKGLLLQDFYIMKKNLILTAGVCLYFFAVLLIGSTSSSSSGMDMVMYGLCGIIPCFLTSCACFTIQPGKTSKNALYIHSCPISSTVITFEKYALTYALFLCSYVIIALFALMDHLICDYIPGKNMLFICFVIFSAILLFTNIELPITMRFGQTVASAVLIAFICIIIVIGLAMFIKINTSSDLSKELNQLLRKKIFISVLLLFIDILSSALSYQTAKRINHM